MKRVVILGSPVARSLSPAIQGAAFDAAGLDWRYEAVETVPPRLPAAIERMRADGWKGANVTIPHKEAVLPLLDDLDPSAAQTSAVNTIVNEGGSLVGHNTDMPGFMLDLQSHWSIPTTGAALILGAGGAARAVAFGLAEARLDLFLISRSARRAERLAEDLRLTHATNVVMLPWKDDSFERAARECVLVVNATPLGMATAGETSPWPAEMPFPPAAFVYDLVYSPRETPLVRDARQAGIDSVYGGGMLLEQGALSFELWTGLNAPKVQMRAALKQALERAHA